MLSFDVLFLKGHLQQYSKKCFFYCLMFEIPDSVYKELVHWGTKKTSFSIYFTVLKVGRGHKMIKRTLRITNFTSTLCVWKGKSSISVQFFITTNLPTCEKFVNIYIFFYSWGAIEKLFENSKTIKTLGLRPRAVWPCLTSITGYV